MLRATVVILLLNMLSRLLGFVRDAVIVWYYGAAVTDAYLVAYSLPYALQAVLGMSFVTVIVPLLSGYLVRGEREEGSLVASSVVNGTGLVLTLVTLAGLAVAPWLVALLAPGFDGEKLALTTQLTRIMFPSIIFMGLGLMVTGVLNTHKRFALPAFAPALANMVVILAVLLFGARYGAQGLAAGTLLGFVGLLLIQLPGLKNLDLKLKWILDYRHPQVRAAVWAILPVTFATGVNQINLAVNRFFASGLAEGSITALDYANRVMNLPLGVFGAAVATAAFPALAQKAAARDWTGFGLDFNRSMRLASFTVLPAAVGLIVLREPVIRLLFERGVFGAENTVMTAEALLYFSLGLWFLAAIYLLTRAYYSLGDLKTPALAGGVAVIGNCLFSLALLPVMGHKGLALANTLAAGVNGGLLFYWLRRRVANWDYRSLGTPLLKMLVASLVMGGIVGYGLRLFGAPRSFIMEGGLVLLLAALGAGVYGLCVLLLGVEEGKKLLTLKKET